MSDHSDAPGLHSGTWMRSLHRAGGALGVSALILLVPTVAMANPTFPGSLTQAQSEGGPLAPVTPAPTPSHSASPARDSSLVAADEEDLRVATLHADLRADSAEGDPTDALIDSMETGHHVQARAVAQTIQLNAPDVVVLTGVSYDEQGYIAESLLHQYLADGQKGATGVEYPYMFTAPTNSGLDSGIDLDGDGVIGGPSDAVGYGSYPGDQGIIVYSKHPIDTERARTFQEVLWKDIPENHLPDEQYSALEQAVLRVNETTLWDLPIEVNGVATHLIASSLADFGPELALEERGHELRELIEDYVSGNGWYLTDDEGVQGPLPVGSRYVLAGALQSEDPEANDDLLQTSGFFQDPAASVVSAVPLSQRGIGFTDADESATRVDESGVTHEISQILPDPTAELSGAGIFWPAEDELGYDVVDPDSNYGLDNRLVWVDIAD